MIKKRFKIFGGGICFFIFLFFRLCKASADLEVVYPTISGQTITASTKLPAYITYLFNFGMEIGVAAVFISLVIAGVMYFLSPVSPDMLSRAKDRVSGAISGLLILVLTYLIVITINPQLNVFNSAPLPPAPQITAPKTNGAGVYFYNITRCSDNNLQPKTTSVSSFGINSRKIYSVGFVKDPDTKTSYISILYGTEKFQGQCQYLNPNESCQPVTPFASSASIYKYSPTPNGDGVYFYRKSCFNNQSSGLDINNIIAQCNANSGGYYKVSNSEIGGGYTKALKNLSFTGSGGGGCTVPQKEQDCVKYDKTGKCTNYNCPALSGENISSVIINGNYLVLFVYSGPKDNPAGPWTYCQEFPAIDDINNLGPAQIKWQNIRNNGGVVPNQVMIIPIQK